MVVRSDRVVFTLNGAPAEAAVALGGSLLALLRDELGVCSVKDGCAPQGQCGCCTVLVDGEPRVACVTPAARVAGRTVTTLEGLDTELRDRLVAAFVDAGASQCGFCTPGILVRLAGVHARGRSDRKAVGNALAAHLCRCTGWQTIFEAAERALGDQATETGIRRSRTEGRDLARATRRATMEGGTRQVVDPSVPAGEAGFADDTAPRDALVAVLRGAGSADEGVEAAGLRWVLGDSPTDARARAGKVQGRRTTAPSAAPLAVPPDVDGAVRLVTSWVEPAYLEPDASWCEPGGAAVTPLANGGAFGGKVHSVVSGAAQELAGRMARPVRVLLDREDCVRLGPKRPPVSATARWDGAGVAITGVAVEGDGTAFPQTLRWPGAISVAAAWSARRVPGPPVSDALRGFPLLEHALLVEGALADAGVDRAALVHDERVVATILDTCVPATLADEAPTALAGARVHVDASGAVQRVDVRVAAGDPLDEVVLRSYCIGAAHMALGIVLSEAVAVDPETGEVLDLTIRSFGVIRPAAMPPVDVTIVDDPGPALPGASDAVLAAVAAAAWNAVARAEGERPVVLPARETRAGRAVRGR